LFTCDESAQKRTSIDMSQIHNKIVIGQLRAPMSG